MSEDLFKDKGIKFRNNVREKMFSNITDKKVAVNIEIGIYMYTYKEAKRKKILKKWENKKFLQLYMDRLRSIYINLKNPLFLEQINNGEITYQAVAFMTHQEMNPIRWKDLIEQKIKREENKNNTGIQASTDMFTCMKCRSKRCTYYELQTRSADEPATVFVTCLDCGKNMKH
jgi:DNA-directed RNA polymerase subunit M/transcription elongation factor TFIIS